MRVLQAVLVFFIILLLTTSCKGGFMQSTAKQLEGTWIRTPLQDTPDVHYEIWEFTEDGYMLLKNTIPDTVQTSASGKDPSQTYADSVEWSLIKTGSTKRLLMQMPIPEIFRTPPPNDYVGNDSLMAVYNASYDNMLYFEQWEVVQVTNKVLQISINEVGVNNGNLDLDLDGDRQITFVRQ